MRLAIVVQRYGEGVVGGSERHARLLAEKLAENHQVTVLTTCAADYRTWDNTFPPGEEEQGGVRILRCPVERKRKWKRFGWKSRTLFSSPHSILQEYEWIVAQGPESPTLIRSISENRDRFDLFLFLTYLYYPTFFGLPVVADKSILVPTAHDEPAIYLSIFQSLFHLPRFIAFNTEEEKELVQRLFHNQYLPHQVVGVGLDPRPLDGRDEGYLLYAGRVERGKNCEELFDLCTQLAVPLKVIGPSQIKVPDSIEYLGTVGDEKKERLFSACRAVVNPSTNESLSLSVLEAWTHGKPVIVSAESPVLRAQVQKSGGGYVYSDLQDFWDILRNLDPRRGEKGRSFVARNYSWDVVLAKYEAIFAAHRADSSPIQK